MGCATLTCSCGKDPRVAVLKRKVIDKYIKHLSDMSVGRPIDYKDTLDMICFIDVLENYIMTKKELKSSILEYYLNKNS